ncbi:MAG: glycosyltransferase [Bacteroidota bacterium]
MTDTPTNELDAAPSPLRRWLKGGAWSVLDQGLFAGANFVVNILLARWLPPEAYGSFAVVFSVFLLAGTLHGGWFVEPMLVFGAGKFESRFAAYVRMLLREHARFSVVTGIGLGIVGAAFLASGNSLLGSDFLAAAAASGFILALWMMRRACYVADRPDWAASAGAVYLVLVIGGAAGLFAMGWLSGTTGFLLMAAGSAIACIQLGYQLGVFRARGDWALRLEARRVHITYGKWAAPTGALEWVHTSLPLLVLPLFVGLEGSGTLRALYNLAQPALHVFSALALIALPAFVRARASGEIHRVAKIVGAGMGALALGYAAVLMVFGTFIVDVLYKGQYAVTTVQLAIIAGISVVAAFTGVLLAWLRSEERPDVIFRARMAAVGAASTVGVALTALFAVAGALASDLISLLVEATVEARHVRKGEKAAATEAETPAADEVGGDGAAHRGAPRGRRRVLIEAFACMPGEGSEGGVGWNMARGMARYHDVWVLTYEGWRKQIEDELAVRPVPGLQFEYVSLPVEPERFRSGRIHRRGIREQVHYLAWQWVAERAAKRLHAEVGFDLAHHATFVKYWKPSAVARLGIPFIWGPVGGGESAPRTFYPAYSAPGRLEERLRDTARKWMEQTDIVGYTAANATISFATTEETARRLRRLGATPVEVRSAIGLSREVIDEMTTVPPLDDGPVRFVCIGRQIPFKGFRFALQAFAEAKKRAPGRFLHAELWMIGDGSEQDRLVAEAHDLGIAGQVRFTGRIPRDEVLLSLRQSHALIHPSLHESGGGVCLEAMAAGRPVVGFRLGGTAVHVPPEAGILVETVAPEPAVAALAGALLEIEADRNRARQMGAVGQWIVSERFCWDDRVREMARTYAQVLAPEMGALHLVAPGTTEPSPLGTKAEEVHGLDAPAP